MAVQQPVWHLRGPEGQQERVSAGADYAFGKESIADLKASFTAAGGKVAGEVYTALGASDFSPYLARIAASRPEAVYAVLSGSDAVLFMKQFAQFGLNKTVKLTVFGDMADEKFIDAVGDSTVGIFSALPWAQDLDSNQNQVFVNAYTRKYPGNLPDVFAMRGWDTARSASFTPHSGRSGVYRSRISPAFAKVPSIMASRLVRSG